MPVCYVCNEQIDPTSEQTAWLRSMFGIFLCHQPKCVDAEGELTEEGEKALRALMDAVPSGTGGAGLAMFLDRPLVEQESESPFRGW